MIKLEVTSLNQHHRVKMSSTTQYYQQHATDFFHSTVDVDMSRLYQQFVPLLPPKAKVLDAGCGSGRDALYFKRLGFDVIAMDASKELAQLASEHLGQQVVVSTFQEMNWEAEFNGIWCCASLLHVPKNDLPAVFSKLADALIAAGILYVSFKYGEGVREHNGRMFTDLTEAELAKLLQTRSDLRLLNCWQTGDVRVGRSEELWLNAVIKKQG